MTLAAAATALGCNAKQAASRLAALGYIEACGRCGGSGRYSYNQTDGDRCFGCGGTGKRLQKVTKALLTEATARVERGDLSDYFARAKRNAEARALLRPLLATIYSEWKNSLISRSYSAASRADGPPLLTCRQYGWYAELGGVGWIGTDWQSGLCLAQTLVNSIQDAAWEIESAMTAGAITNPVRAAADLTELLSMLREVNAYVTADVIRGWGFAAAE